MEGMYQRINRKIGILLAFFHASHAAATHTPAPQHKSEHVLSHSTRNNREEKKKEADATSYTRTYTQCTEYRILYLVYSLWPETQLKLLGPTVLHNRTLNKK